MPNDMHRGAARPGRGRAPRAARPQKQKKGDKRDDPGYDADFERSVRFANRGCALAFLAACALMVVVLLFVVSMVFSELNGGAATANGTVTVDVPLSAGGSTIARVLKEAGLINNENIFKFYVRFNGAGAGFQAGRYQLQAGMSYDELIEALSQAPPPRTTVTVTFPEGSTVAQFASIAEKAGLCTAAEFIDAANNGDYSHIEFWNHIDTLPGTYMKAEGYLSPDTYEFYSDGGAEYVVEKLYQQFDKNINDINFITDDGEKTFYEMLEIKNITLRDAVTMASIIEEESASVPSEQAGVSGVFWNRLLKDHPAGDFARRTMGTDATTRFLADFVAPSYAERDYTDWTLADIKADMLTYVPHDVFYAYYTGDEDENSREGLPVGPISCPSMTAVFAAMEPEMHNYYYFVTDDYGEFRYATNLREHLRNVDAAAAANIKKAEEDAAASASQG